MPEYSRLMAARLARGAVAYLKGSGGNLCLQLRAADHARAAEAVEQARRLICEIPSSYELRESAASYVSESMRLPDGPAFMIDLADEPVSILRKAADIVVEQAEAVGLVDAEVGPPPNRRDAPFWNSGSGLVPGVWYPQLLLRARRYGPGRFIFAKWVDGLLDWLLEGTVADDHVWVAIVSVAFPVPASEVRAFLDPPAGGIVQVSVGTDRSRALYYSGNGVTCDAVVYTAGTAVTPDDSAAMVERLKHLSRSLAADLDYAALDYRQTGSHGDPGVRYSGIFAESARLEAVASFAIPQVFAWQILGPEHIARLGGPPVGAQVLTGDRFEIGFGSLPDWSNGTDSHAARRAEALRSLEPLLHEPHMIWVSRGENNWGTQHDVRTKIETALTGGSWASRRIYRLRTPDHPLTVEIEHQGRAVLFYPAGASAAKLAREVAASFSGEIQERRPAPPHGRGDRGG